MQYLHVENDTFDYTTKKGPLHEAGLLKKKTY